MTHQLELTYYNSDDGVWLRCSCGEFETNLGFSATPDDAKREEARHLEEVK
jgi:hypothetical protein